MRGLARQPWGQATAIVQTTRPRVTSQQNGPDGGGGGGDGGDGDGDDWDDGGDDDDDDWDDSRIGEK